MKRWLVCTLLCLGLLTPHARAESNPEEAARRHYERALALYEEAAYDAALGELLRAYELRPSPVLIYNIAMTHLALHDHASALVSFRQYLGDGKGLTDPRRAEVEGQIRELEQRVATVSLTVDVDGADVLIDQRAVGKTPLKEPLVVNSGRRVISVQHPSHAPYSQQLQLAGGDAVPLQVSLAGGRSQVSSTNSEPVAAEPESGARRKRRMWISWGATGALAVTALACGIAALSAEGRIEDERNKLNGDRDQMESDATRGRRLAITTDILTVATAGAAGLSLWFTLKGRRSNTERPASTVALRVAPTAVLLRANY